MREKQWEPLTTAEAVIAPAQPAADELRGGAVEPARAVSAAAQKIAERVPLPDFGINTAAMHGPRIKGYTAAQMEALRLAVAEEAIRVSSAQSPDALKLSDHALASMPPRGAEAVAKIERAPNGMIGLFRPDGGPFDMSKYVGATLYTTPPAGSVEVTDAESLAGYRSMLTPPYPDTICIVLVELDGKLSPRIDTWCMQSEAPLEWSSATIETGYCWDDHDPFDVLGWKPVGPLPSASELEDLAAALQEPEA